MKNHIIRTCFSLLLALTLTFSVVTIVPNENYNVIAPMSILDDEEPSA